MNIKDCDFPNLELSLLYEWEEWKDIDFLVSLGGRKFQNIVSVNDMQRIRTNGLIYWGS